MVIAVYENLFSDIFLNRTWILLPHKYQIFKNFKKVWSYGDEVVSWTISVAKKPFYIILSTFCDMYNFLWKYFKIIFVNI